MRVEEHTIEVAGSPVFYRRAVAPGAPVLYLHGIPTSADDWTELMEPIGGIAPDLPGFGRTAKAGNLDYSIDGHADFLEHFLDELDVARVTIVAHDWGAGGGLAFAQRHPDRIERLVLIDALPLLEGFRWHRLARLWCQPVVGELMMGSVNRWLLARTLRRGATAPDAWSDQRVDAVWAQFDQGTQRALLRLHRAEGASRLAAAGADLEQLEVPALVIWGEQDPWFAPVFAERYAARLPDATVMLIAGAGHWPWLDDPGMIERIVAFLE